MNEGPLFEGPRAFPPGAAPIERYGNLRNAAVFGQRPPPIAAPEPSSALAVIGIDPGLEGGISVLDPNAQILLCESFPTFEVEKKPRKGQKQRRSGEYDLPALYELLCRARAAAQAASWVGCVLALEQLGPNPKNGVISAWKVSRGMTFWEAWAVALGLRLERLHPKRWHALICCEAGPKASLARAREMFPDAPLSLEKHSGRAASLLIAEAARRSL